jgi:hypothetical protein
MLGSPILGDFRRFSAAKKIGDHLFLHTRVRIVRFFGENIFNAIIAKHRPLGSMNLNIGILTQNMYRYLCLVE